MQHLGRNLHDYHDSSDNQRTPERIDGKKRPLIINTQGGVSANLRFSQNNLWLNKFKLTNVNKTNFTLILFI